MRKLTHWAIVIGRSCRLSGLPKYLDYIIRFGQSGRNFVGGIFKCILLNESIIVQEMIGYPTSAYPISELFHCLNSIEITMIKIRQSHTWKRVFTLKEDSGHFTAIC